MTAKDIPGEVMNITTYGAHGVLVTASTKAGYEMAPKLLRPGGTMVCVGLPKDDTIIAGAHPIMMCLKKLNVVGSVVGTLKDVEEVSSSLSTIIEGDLLRHPRHSTLPLVVLCIRY